MADGRTKEKRKKIALAVLMGLLAIVVAWQAFFSGPSSRPATSTQPGRTGTTPGTTSTTSSPVQSRSGSQTERDAEIQRLLSDITPLDFSAVAAANGVAEVKRNVFAYYVPPPPKPDPPPPPPPIAVRSVQPPAAVAGTPRPFVLTVSGEGFPDDAQIIFGGVIKPTKRVNTGQLSTEITPAEYSGARTISVEVKSQSKPVEFYSNPVSFTAQQAPPPPFKFLGIIADLAVLELTRARNETIRVRKGDKVDGVWRIDSISETGVEVTDTRYDIRRRVP
jgi:hypothetical protein